MHERRLKDEGKFNVVYIPTSYNPENRLNFNDTFYIKSRALALKALDKRLQATSNKLPRTSRFDSSSNLPSSPPPPPLSVNTPSTASAPRPGEVSSPALFDTNQNDGSKNAIGNAGSNGK